MSNTNKSSFVYTHLVLISRLVLRKNSLGTKIRHFCVKQQQQISSRATFRRGEGFLTCIAKYVREGWLLNSVKFLCAPEKA